LEKLSSTWYVFEKIVLYGIARVQRIEVPISLYLNFKRFIPEKYFTTGIDISDTEYIKYYSIVATYRYVFREKYQFIYDILYGT